MIMFNTVRAGRQDTFYMEKLIRNMYSDERKLFWKGYGVLDNTAEAAIYSFYAVRNTYKGHKPINVHYMEIHIDHVHDVSVVSVIAEAMGRYFWETGFQSVISAIDTRTGYVITMAVNAVSFCGSRMFHDNNMQHYAIYEYLKGVVPFPCSVGASENTIFSKTQEGNYVHGIYA